MYPMVVFAGILRHKKWNLKERQRHIQRQTPILNSALGFVVGFFTFLSFGKERYIMACVMEAISVGPTRLLSICSYLKFSIIGGAYRMLQKSQSIQLRDVRDGSNVILNKKFFEIPHSIQNRKANPVLVTTRKDCEH
jgi:hypothetical protein